MLTNTRFTLILHSKKRNENSQITSKTTKRRKFKKKPNKNGIQQIYIMNRKEWK